MLVLNIWENPIEDEYTVVGRSGKKNLIKWYRIRIPTAWINIDDILFSLEEIE